MNINPKTQGCLKLEVSCSVLRGEHAIVALIHHTKNLAVLITMLILMRICELHHKLYCDFHRKLMACLLILMVHLAGKI